MNASVQALSPHSGRRYAPRTPAAPPGPRVQRQPLAPQAPLALRRPGLVLLLDGEATLLAHDWCLRLQPGTVAVSDGRERLDLRCGPGARASVLCLWPEPDVPGAALAGTARKHAPRTPLLPLVHEPGSAIAVLMQQLAGALARSGRSDAQESRQARFFLGAMLAAQDAHDAQIARCHGRTHARRRELFVRLARARMLLAAEAEDALDVARLARIARLSTSHFVRLFHRVFGEPPHRYRARRRMERARLLLLHTALPVSEVLWRVGYASHSCFARAFRQHFGCTASELRSGSRAS